MQDKKVAGRAYTVGEKRIIVERIYAAWIAFEDMRLGQLMINSIGNEDLFYTEDDRLVSLVDEFVSQVTAQRD